MDFGLYALIFGILSVFFGAGFFFAFRYGMKHETMILIIPSIILFISTILSLGLMVLLLLRVFGVVY